MRRLAQKHESVQHRNATTRHGAFRATDFPGGHCSNATFACTVVLLRQVDSNERSSPVSQTDTDRLRQDLRHVVEDLEQVLRSAVHATGEEASELKSQAVDRLHDARLRLGDMERDAADRVREAAQLAKGYVQQHPWAVIGGASTVAFLLGMLVRSRR
jgi:ElaB/YqjD/DUF883 family membrane-anchored ribosome-binding protein